MNPLITAAGSSTDIVARTVGHKVSDALGQSVVIENKPGAGGTIGTPTTTGSRLDRRGVTLARDTAVPFPAIVLTIAHPATSHS